MGVLAIPVFTIIKPQLWMVILYIIVMFCGFGLAVYIASDIDKYIGGLSNKEKFKKMLNKWKRYYNG